MAKCTYCGTEIPKGTGLMYVKEDGSIFYFDKRKCRMGMLKLKRNPRYIRWTHAFVKGKPEEKKTTA